MSELTHRFELQVASEAHIDRGSRIAAIAACAAAPADLALSDSVFVQAQQAVNRTVAKAEFIPAVEWIASRGAISGIIMAESFFVGLAVSRSRRMQGAFGGFDEYTAERQKHMNKPRKALSVAANAPLVAIGKLGEGIEKLGSNFTEHDSLSMQKAGEYIIDAGKTNAMGTTAVILQETGESETPLPAGRIAKLGAIITASWVAASEVVRYGYRGVGELGRPGQAVQGAIGAAARGFDTLTSVDFMNPASTPVGLVTMGAVAVALGITGNNIVRYQDEQYEKQQNALMAPAGTSLELE